MVYAEDLKSFAARLAGSSPALPTKKNPGVTPGFFLTLVFIIELIFVLERFRNGGMWSTAAGSGAHLGVGWFGLF